MKTIGIKIKAVIILLSQDFEFSVHKKLLALSETNQRIMMETGIKMKDTIRLLITSIL